MTIFGKIIKKEIPSDIVYENERLIAIVDINPVAPVHLLIMPKKEYSSLQAIPVADLPIISEIMEVAQQLAKKYGVENGYRLLTNVGADAGQTIFHLHFHLIGGKHLGPMA